MAADRRPRLQIPGNVFAGHTHTGALTVKPVQVIQVAQHDFADFVLPRGRQQDTGRQIVFNFAENPGPPLSRAPDHHRVGAGAGKHMARLFRTVDVSIGQHRNVHRCLDGANRVVFRFAAIQIGPGASMYRECLDAGLFRERCDAYTVFVLAVPAGTNFKGHGNVH